MILTGKEIELQIKQERILISPFDAKNLQPNSYDLHLDCSEYEIFKGFDIPEMQRWFLPEEEKFNPIYEKKSNNIDYGFFLEPNTCYLFSTIETTHTDYYAPMIEGVSTNARVFLTNHQTAGFGDVGFNGKWTLEIKVSERTPVYHGMRIAQICFHELSGEIELYKGRYQNQNKVEGAKV
jgi:dCTP deaminase